MKIFLLEGWLISLTGSFLGILAGTGIAWIQEKFAIIRLGGNGSFVLDSYPVDIQIFDIFLGRGVQDTVKTRNNAEGMAETLEAMRETERGLIAWGSQRQLIHSKWKAVRPSAKFPKLAITRVIKRGVP